jgi:hypothetical protein
MRATHVSDEFSVSLLTNPKWIRKYFRRKEIIMTKNSVLETVNLLVAAASVVAVKPTDQESELYLAWMQEVPDRLKDHDGIKCQLAAAANVVVHLGASGCGWTFTPTTPGSPDDLGGIDGFLENNGRRIPVDFSLESNNNPAGHKKDQVWLVHLSRDWFAAHVDGSVHLRASCKNALFRAFLPVLEAEMSS